MDSTKEFRVLSLFTGYGGIERGIERTGIRVRTIASVEIEAYAVANLVDKMETGKMVPHPIFTNVKTLPVQPFYRKIDCITGGFPCQPFSAAGNRKADEDPRHLFPYVLRAVKSIRPRYVFLENVFGLLSAKLGGGGWNDPQGTPVLLHVIRELERLGYRAEAGVFSAEEAGAPHQRKRVFILAEELGHSEHDEYSPGSIIGEIERSEEKRRLLKSERTSCRSIDELADSKCDRFGGRSTAIDSLDSERIQVREGESSGENIRCETSRCNRTPRTGNSSNIPLTTSGNDRGHFRESEEGQVQELRESCFGNDQFWDTTSEQCERCEQSRSRERRSKEALRVSSNCGEWPSRPNEEQFCWEEPRVVANTNNGRSGENKQQTKLRTIRVEQPSESSRIQCIEREKCKISKRRDNDTSTVPRKEKCEFEIESELGRTVDGNTCWMDSTIGRMERVDSDQNRIDRIRMCGNGVNPHTAEKAFRILMSRL